MQKRKRSRLTASGPHEVLIFSDYFCPPCQALEPKLEPVLDALYKQGNVKIRFVDTPMHKETPLFAKFYLYAAKAAPDYRAAVRARQVLFALAGKENVFWMDERIEEAFRKEKIAFTPFDFRTVQPELNGLITQHRVDSTPTCVILSPGKKAQEVHRGGRHPERAYISSDHAGDEIAAGKPKARSPSGTA